MPQDEKQGISGRADPRSALVGGSPFAEGVFMEITDAQFEKCVEALVELNNTSENILATISDVVTALHSQLARMEFITHILADIVKQSAPGPS